MPTRYEIHVAELCRLMGSVEGGFHIECKDETDVVNALKELESEVAADTYNPDYSFPSLKWCIVDNHTDEVIPESKFIN